MEEGIILADFVPLAENPLAWNESHGSFVGLSDVIDTTLSQRWQQETNPLIELSISGFVVSVCF